MKKLLSVLLSAALLASFQAGCGQSTSRFEDLSGEISGTASESLQENTEDLPDTYVCNDGRARPSSCGKLQVKDGKLCSADGEPVMLRGVSCNGLITSESFLNEQLFRELAEDDGVNLFRFAMYTYGVGIVGYCTGGDKERHKEDIALGVELARDNDMYALIDWHILSDGDPNTYVEEAKLFFAETAESFRDYDNVLYEICNEPNGIDWQTVKRYADEVIPVIRAQDPDAVIIVGNPDWSKDLYSVAADPLEYGNILYSLHFYSASHGQNFREMTEEVSRNGLPVFVTEFGITSSSGGFPRDTESADEWIELLEKENISYCMWSFSKAPEACSAIRSSVLSYSGVGPDDYTDTGLWLLDTLAKHNTR